MSERLTSMNRGVAHVIAVTILLSVIFSWQVGARDSQQVRPTSPIEDKGARLVPARTIPVPTTVSPELQKNIAQPVGPNERFWSTVPKSTEEWRQLIAQTEKAGTEGVVQLLKRYPVKVESQTVSGVRTFAVLPQYLPEENRTRILVHIHGGAYVFYGGEAGVGEAILAAHHSKMKVVSIDYRMPPDHPFPAALDDTVAVYEELLKTYKPEDIAIFGTSSGGGLAAAAILRLRDLKVPLPAAVGLGTPWADVTRTGDTLHTNEQIDDVLVVYGGLLNAAAKLYAGPVDMKDPLISPIYGDLSKGFPPTILTSGTRDLLLSCTVRMHRKLRQAGIEAELQVFEGMSHAEYLLIPDLPEGEEAFQEIARFFSSHMGK
jgi:epsilon-lactone hydrolase